MSEDPTVRGAGAVTAPGGSTAGSAAWAPGGQVGESLRCNRCGFPVSSRPWGCKNPCTNCGTVYPLGDCSD